MNEKYVKIITIFLIFFFSLSLRLWTLNQIGRTWDEAEYIEHGYKLVELIVKGDFNNTYFYTTYNHPPLVKYIYGIFAHFDVEKMVNGEPVFRYDLTYSRLLSALMFSLGVVITAVIGWRIFSPVIGIVSGIILSMLPFSLGLSQLVTTESLKIFVYPLVIYGYINLAEKFSVKNIIIAGILTGIALQAKQSNALLIPMLAVIFFFQYKLLKAKEKDDFIKTRVISLIGIVAISIVVFILIWPQVLFHFSEVYKIHQKLWNVQFSPKIWQITLSPPEIFFGRLMLTPIFYYFVYLFITIPVGILGLFFIGLVNSYRRKNWKIYTVIIWLLLPFTLSVYSWRQHGLRYIIEIYPSLALLAAVGFEVLISKITKTHIFKLVYFFPVMLYMFLLLLQIKPYYLDYFNELVGGTATVYKYRLFQIGWWGQGLKEASLYIVQHVPKRSRIGLAISPMHVFPSLPEFYVEKFRKEGIYDYVVVNFYNVLREGFDDNEIKRKYIPAYHVYANGAILATVYKRK